MSAMNIMVDTETLGVSYNAVVCTIGAVRFDLDGPVDQEFEDTFYVTIDAKDSVDKGLVIDQSTLDWWGHAERKEAFKELRKNNIPLVDAYEKFTEWHGKNTKQPIWANSPSFDLVLMDSGYKAAGLERPWLPWFERDYRTVKNLISVKLPKRTGAHKAVDDAKYQARHLLLMLKS